MRPAADHSLSMPSPSATRGVGYGALSYLLDKRRVYAHAIHVGSLAVVKHVSPTRSKESYGRVATGAARPSMSWREWEVSFTPAHGKGGTITSSPARGETVTASQLTSRCDTKYVDTIFLTYDQELSIFVPHRTRAKKGQPSHATLRAAHTSNNSMIWKLTR